MQHIFPIFANVTLEKKPMDIRYKDNGPSNQVFFTTHAVFKSFWKYFPFSFFQKYINLSSCDNFQSQRLKTSLKGKLQFSTTKKPPKKTHTPLPQKKPTKKQKKTIIFRVSPRCHSVMCLKDNRRFNSRNTDWSRLTICRSKASIGKFA